jgi:ABC-type taurine transport system ATPase subunit
VIGGGGELNPPTRLLVESESTSAVDALRVRVGGSTKLYVSGAGQVGVNTTNVAAGFELSVNGQVICTELVVQEPGNWPDYVFSEDYELMPLEALEASIKENKHLPGVPTAAEVKDGGVSIGDMQKQMLEKIEELTLYVIEQNKRLKAQDEQIQSLRAELTAGR